MLKRKQALNIAVGTVAMAVGSMGAKAASLVTFDALPTSANLPEFAFTNTLVPQFVASSGATGTGNGDGLLSRSAQVVGGLGIQTPLHVVGDSAIELSTGGTAFDDVTLVLTDLAATGPASPLGAAEGDVIVQPLTKLNPLSSTPTFALYATSLHDTDYTHGQLLLQGTITKASLAALSGDDTAAVLSSKVTYTGGAIYDVLFATGGTTTGSLSWSLLDIRDSDGNPSVTIDPLTGFFKSFTANGTGLFSTPTVPEPTSAAIVAIPMLAMIVQRRRTARI